MRKALSLFLCLCIMIVLSQSVAFAAEKIESFDITMSGFAIGAKKKDVKFTLADERLEVASQSFTGKFSEDDTFLEQKSYRAMIGVRGKSGKIYFSLRSCRQKMLDFQGLMCRIRCL